MADNDETLPLSPGDRFGDYIVERMLGRGSMGTVYLMRTPDGSAYAVKIMHRDKMTHDMRVRFVREAEATMGVRHRNLVAVHDVGEDPDTGLCYIIMDYVPGGTLADRIATPGELLATLRRLGYAVPEPSSGGSVRASSGADKPFSYDIPLKESDGSEFCTKDKEIQSFIENLKRRRERAKMLTALAAAIIAGLAALAVLPFRR